MGLCEPFKQATLISGNQTLMMYDITHCYFVSQNLSKLYPISRGVFGI